MSREVHHLVIRASAGSGKTYRLTTRFIELLALGVAPERIIALTFTRKAAGEFLDRTLGRLAAAAEDETAAAELASEIGCAGELATHDFAALLATLAQALHRVFLGTLDSFFHRSLRVFALESGLGGEFELVHGHAAEAERRRVIESLGGTAAAGGDPRFFEAFKQATFGAEETRVIEVLEALVAGGHDRVLEVPDGDLWGNPKRIWRGGKGDPWFRFREADGPRLAAELVRELEAVPFTEAMRRRVPGMAEEVAAFTPASEIGGDLRMLVTAATKPDVCDDVRAGRPCRLTFHRKPYEFSALATGAVRDVVDHVIGMGIRRAVERTRGVWRVLAAYEEGYDRLVRRRGRLSFGDVTRLLASRLGGGGADELAYRMDGRHDHWLLDEFQDTGRDQWRVVAPLIDEVIQDPERRRTYFQVGDTKQAIYGWRGGDVRLFDEVESRYNRGSDPSSPEVPIRSEPLDRSYRSAPAVIELVNRVFSDAEGLARVLPEATVRRWEWRDHESARTDLPGEAVFVRPPVSGEAADGDGDGANDAPDAERPDFHLVAAILEELDPEARELTVGVLVQRNRVGRELVDYLRRHGRFRVVMDAETDVGVDNPVTSAFLALFQGAAHPGDRIAEHHVRLSPFGDWMVRENRSWPSVVVEVLAEAAARGIEQTVWTWHARLETVADLDAFSRSRLADFAGSAQEFDRAGNRDLGEFVRFATGYAVRETGRSGVVQVMTVHASKGLDFDAVIVLDLEGRAMDAVVDSLPTIHRDAGGRPEWVCALPPMPILEHDETLRDHREGLRADQAYDRLCLAYVALTRAKQGLYVVGAPATPRGGASRTMGRLLRETLGSEPGGERTFAGCVAEVLWACEGGDPGWFRTRRAERPSPARPAADGGDEGVVVAACRRFPRLPRSTPSGEERQVVTGEVLFAPGSRDAREAGTAVHAFFERIEWLEDISVKAVLEDWRREFAGVLGAAGGRLAEELRTALDDPAVRALLERPKDGGAAGHRLEVWRERTFELVADGTWITGTFDRVVVAREPGGRATGATVVDFKSDRIDTGGSAVAERVERYRPQLARYREVVARMTGLPAEAVQCRLLFTAAPCVEAV